MLRITREKKAANKFLRGCKCVNHELFSIGRTLSKRIHKVNNNDYSRQALNWLIDNGFLSRKSQTICGGCIEYASEMLNTNSHTKAKRKPREPDSSDNTTPPTTTTTTTATKKRNPAQAARLKLK